MDTRPIGMFDSGIGGLTVYKEVKKMLPDEEIIYLGDTKRFPYGSKSKQAIIDISRKCIEFLISKNVKIIIIACGTATSQALDTLKKEFEVPIIGIIMPTVEYIKNTIKGNKNTVGIIATKGTIRSGAWEKKLKQNIDNINIINEEAPLLATMAEQGWTNNKVAKYTIKEYMKTFKKVDKLILGCTHYPLFEDLIKKELRKNVEIINTGTKVASYLKAYILKNDMTNSSKIKKDRVYLTDYDTSFKESLKMILKEDNLEDILEINENSEIIKIT